MIPQSRINRWYFAKEANAINAASMARYAKRTTGIELYDIYADLFYSLRELLKKNLAAPIRIRAKEMHDLACQQLLDGIQFDLGSDAYNICKDCLFTFNN